MKEENGRLITGSGRWPLSRLWNEQAGLIVIGVKQCVLFLYEAVNVRQGLWVRSAREEITLQCLLWGSDSPYYVGRRIWWLVFVSLCTVNTDLLRKGEKELRVEGSADTAFFSLLRNISMLREFHTFRGHASRFYVDSWIDVSSILHTSVVRPNKTRVFFTKKVKFRTD